MRDTYKNIHGVLLGANGYVVCLTCGKEVQGISTETSADYAYCLHHKRKDDIMAAVLKPSQAKNRVKVSPVKNRKRARNAEVNASRSAATSGQHGGRIARLIARVTETRGMDRAGILQLCENEKLSKKTASNTLCVLRKLGLVHVPQSAT
jgi:hypothetical protein